MERKRNLETLVIVVLTIAIVVMSVGFASIGRDLEINGSANVSASSWNVAFNTESYVATTGSNAITPAQDDLNVSNTSITYNVDFTQPGQFYEFKIDVENNGTFDASLDGITMSTVDSHLKYTVKYNDTEYTQSNTNISGVTLGKNGSDNSTATVTVRVEYKMPETESEILGTDLNDVELNLTLSYSQNETQS